MLGDEYIAQHVEQACLQEEREYQYHRYVTEALYAISHGNQAMVIHWTEIDPGFEPVEPARSVEKIQADLLAAVNEGRTA